MSDTFKRIGILTIVILIVVLAVGEQTGTLDISDSEDAMFGAVYNNNGDPVYGSEELTNSLNPLAIISAQKQYCVNQRYYHTYYATSVHSASYFTEEKKLWDKLQSGISCSVRQRIITPSGSISQGTFHTLSKTSYGGATAYSAGSLRTGSTQIGSHTYYVQAKCADAINIWIVDSKRFTVENCAADVPSLDDLIKACDAKDDPYCSGSYLYVKDYSLINGVCAATTKYVDNEACYDKWKAGVCADNGYEYDSTSNDCVTPPTTPTVPGEPTQPDDPSVDLPPVDEFVDICVIQPLLCDDTGTEKQPPVEDDIEQMSWLEANKGVLIIGGFVIVGMLILLGAILVRRLKR